MVGPVVVKDAVEGAGVPVNVELIVQKAAGMETFSSFLLDAGASLCPTPVRQSVSQSVS